MPILDERERRQGLWERIRSTPPSELKASLLRELRVYGGAQGIWVDSHVTSNASPTSPTLLSRSSTRANIILMIFLKKG